MLSWRSLLNEFWWIMHFFTGALELETSSDILVIQSIQQTTFHGFLPSTAARSYITPSMVTPANKRKYVSTSALQEVISFTRMIISIINDII